MIEELKAREKIIEFESRFGRGAQTELCFAPGRINLMGEFIDILGGTVLSMATEQGTSVMIRNSGLSPSRLYSEIFNQEIPINQSDPEREGAWADYIHAVCKFSSDICGDIPPFDAYYFGDLPVEAGLSSSSSLEVVTCIGLAGLGCNLKKEDILKIARKAEIEFLHTSSPVNDHIAVIYGKKGHALLIDCDNFDFRYSPFNLEDVEIVVAHGDVKSTFSGSELTEKLRDCSRALEMLSRKIPGVDNLCRVSIGDFEKNKWSLPEDVSNITGYIVYESARVEEAARCLENGDKAGLGRLMNRSHQSFRDHFGVVNEDLEILKEIADNQPGVWGSRMAGSAIGGCVISIVDKDEVEHFMRRVSTLFWRSAKIDTQFISTGAGGGPLNYGVRK